MKHADNTPGFGKMCILKSETGFHPSLLAPKITIARVIHLPNHDVTLPVEIGTIPSYHPPCSTSSHPQLKGLFSLPLPRRGSLNEFSLQDPSCRLDRPLHDNCPGCFVFPHPARTQVGTSLRFKSSRLSEDSHDLFSSLPPYPYDVDFRGYYLQACLHFPSTLRDARCPRNLSLLAMCGTPIFLQSQLVSSLSLKPPPPSPTVPVSCFFPLDYFFLLDWPCRRMTTGCT